MVLHSSPVARLESAVALIWLALIEPPPVGARVPDTSRALLLVPLLTPLNATDPAVPPVLSHPIACVVVLYVR